MPDDAAFLDVGADHETWHIGEEQQRNLERIAQPDEARRLVGRVVEQHSAFLHGLVGDDAHRLALEPREPGQQLSGKQLFDLDPAALVDDSVDQLAHVVAAVRLFRDQLADRLRAEPRGLGLARRRLFACALRHVTEISLRELDRPLVVRHQRIAQPTFGGMHSRPTQFLEGHLLSDHNLDHARGAEVHRRVAFDHDHDVAESGDVRAARRGRAEQHADLRHHARQLHLVEEDAACVAAAGKHLDLVRDAGARRVDQIEERYADARGGFLDADDLLDRPRAPAARLHRRVVRHHGDLAALDRPESGHHPVCGQLLGEHVGEQSVLDE